MASVDVAEELAQWRLGHPGGGRGVRPAVVAAVGGDQSDTDPKNVGLEDHPANAVVRAQGSCCHEDNGIADCSTSGPVSVQDLDLDCSFCGAGYKEPEESKIVAGLQKFESTPR